MIAIHLVIIFNNLIIKRDKIPNSMFIIDIFLCINTAYFKNGVICNSRAKIFKHYRKSKNFKKIFIFFRTNVQRYVNNHTVHNKLLLLFSLQPIHSVHRTNHAFKSFSCTFLLIFIFIIRLHLFSAWSKNSSIRKNKGNNY